MKQSTFYIQSGQYKVKKVASNVDDAAIQAVRYMLLEQIPCGLFLVVSKKKYFEDLKDNSKDAINTYFIPTLLNHIGENEHAENLSEEYRRMGFDVDELQSKFENMSKNEVATNILLETIKSLKQDIAKIEKQIEQNQEDIAELESLYDDGEEWKNA